MLDLDAGIETARRLIAQAGRDKADLVVFPETWLGGYPAWVFGMAGWDSADARHWFGKLVEASPTLADPAIDALRDGTAQVAEFQRFGKGGKEVWIQASYNPIVGADGKVYKVVKFAIDVTGRKAAVNMLRDGLARLAAGDLKTRIDTTFIPELDDVRQAFNSSLDQFAQIVSRLRVTSTNLKTATSEILAGASDLSLRTSRRAQHHRLHGGHR